MRFITVITSILFAILVMWLPARTPAEVFEEQALKEAWLLQVGDGMPMPETAATLAGVYIEGLKAITHAPERFSLRPYAERIENDGFEEIGRAAQRATGTAWARSMKSLFVMATQRLAILSAAVVALMPFILALMIDGFVARRIREARYHAPSPTLWKASLALQVLIVCAGSLALVVPAVSPLVLPVFPVMLAFALRLTAATWHRFI